MTGALLLVFGGVFFLLGFLFYGKYLCRLFGVDPERPTPAHTMADGVDYVATKCPILLGHHFASIAGAGPIVGPMLAAYFGWVPVALWVLLGCVFIGAVHDFAALFVSVRHEGRSIGYIVEEQLGYFGRQIFLLFTFAALLLVVVIFDLLVAETFVVTPAVATASVLFMAIAPVFGYLVYRRGVSIMVSSLIFVPLMFAFIWVGILIPFDLTRLLGISVDAAKKVWMVGLFVYCYVASILPVWQLLQPRDYLNSYLLYAMIFLGCVSILFVSPGIVMPAFTGLVAVQPGGGMTPLFPLLFVTVACGACSGFHALVASGTTAKQIGSERHIRPIGYGAMLIEGLLALLVLITVASLTKEDYFEALRTRGPVGTFANGLAGFSAKLGLPVETGRTFIALAISAFILTTLDTATRLTRYAWEELFLPPASRTQEQKGLRAFLSNRYMATFVIVLASGYLAFSGNAGQIWPVFGGSNQLLAALTLLTVTLILFRQRKNFWITLLPMLFMLVVCVWALANQFMANIHAEKVNWSLVIATGFLEIMAVVLVIRAIRSLTKLRG